MAGTSSDPERSAQKMSPFIKSTKPRRPTQELPVEQSLNSPTFNHCDSLAKEPFDRIFWRQSFVIMALRVEIYEYYPVGIGEALNFE